MCKVFTGYIGTSEIEHGLISCTVDNPLAKARGLSLRTGAQTMPYLSHVSGYAPFTNTETDSVEATDDPYVSVRSIRNGSVNASAEPGTDRIVSVWPKGFAFKF